VPIADERLRRIRPQTTGFAGGPVDRRNDMTHLSQLVEDFFALHCAVTDGSDFPFNRPWEEHGDALTAISTLSESDRTDALLLLGDLASQFAHTCERLLGTDAVRSLVRDEGARGWTTVTTRDAVAGVRAFIPVVDRGSQSDEGCEAIEEAYWDAVLADDHDPEG
jgi:hypothetical protein